MWVLLSAGPCVTAQVTHPWVRVRLFIPLRWKKALIWTFLCAKVGFFGNNPFYLNSKIANLSSQYTGSTLSDVTKLTLVSGLWLPTVDHILWRGKFKTRTVGAAVEVKQPSFGFNKWAPEWEKLHSNQAFFISSCVTFSSFLNLCFLS